MHGNVSDVPDKWFKGCGDDVPSGDHWRMRRGGDMHGNVGDVPR